MTIQEYVRKIDNLKWQIESKKEKILALEAVATNSTAAITGMPHNPSPSPSRVADAISRKIDLENSIAEDEAEIQRLKDAMSAAIEQIDEPKYQAVLYKRFIRNMTADEIADEIAYCQRTAQRLLQKATKLLESILAGE